MNPSDPVTHSSNPPGVPGGPERVTQDHRARIFEFDPIRRSGKLTVLLDYLLCQAETETAAEVDQYRIAFDCFGMNSSFDPSLSSLVRVHLSKLRKILRDYADGPGKEDPIRITLPLGSYALEIRPADVAVPKHQPVIGLAEFRGIGLEKEWEFLPALISEQLGDRLSKSESFDLVGPFPRDLMGDGASDLRPSAGKHAAMDCVIGGHLHRKQGGIELGLRISNAPTGQVTWTSSLEIPMDGLSSDGVGHQWITRLSSMIVGDYGGLDVHFSRLARMKPEHLLSAEEAVLLGRMYFTDFNPAVLFKVAHRLREVVRSSPGDPLAMATLAMLLVCAGNEPRWTDPVPAEEVRRLAAAAWQMAPDQPWVILASAFAACFDGQDHVVRRLASSIERDPDAPGTTRYGLGVLLCLRCIDLEKGLRLIEDARRMNPEQPCGVHVVEAVVALRCGDPDHALERLNAYRIPWGWADPLIRGAIHVLRGEPERAADEYRAVMSEFPDLERAAASNRLIWHRDHIEFLIGIFAKVGITAESCRS
jgi:hypothetical protein